jgi:hypothetical protein
MYKPSEVLSMTDIKCAHCKLSLEEETMICADPRIKKAPLWRSPCADVLSAGMCPILKHKN